MCRIRCSVLHGKAGEFGLSRSLLREYKKMNEKLGMKQYLVPYLMSSHPGSTLKEAVELAEHLTGSGLHAGAGTGFLPDAVHDLHLYVLYRAVIRAPWKSVYRADEPA